MWELVVVAFTPYLVDSGSPILSAESGAYFNHLVIFLYFMKINYTATILIN